MKTFLKNNRFILCMLGGIIAGCLVGAFAPAFGKKIEFLGTVFINLMFCVVVPMVFCSISSAIANMKSARRAGKMARKYLKLAEKERAKGDNMAYYEALLNGLNSYLCAKLYIPPSNLSKERIAEVMRANGLSDELVSRTLSVQSDLELARFAPSEEGGLRDELYKTASEVIDGIEASKIKIID